MVTVKKEKELTDLFLHRIYRNYTPQYSYVAIGHFETNTITIILMHTIHLLSIVVTPILVTRYTPPLIPWYSVKSLNQCFRNSHG